jgi:TRAP-type C4-dicarboxylate transport system permease small subunit
MSMNSPSAPASGLTTAFQTYVRAMQAAAAFAMGLIVVILTAQVFYRYFLSGSLIWAEELSRCLLVWTCFLFAGIAYQRGEMASVDLVTRKLPPGLRTLFMVPALVAAMAFIAVLAWQGALYANQNHMQILPGVSMLWRKLTGSTGGFSIFWVYISIPIGLGILFLHMLSTLVRLLRDARAPRTGGSSL